MALGVVDEHLDRVEAHRLGVDQAGHELGRIEELQEGRLVRSPREGGGVALVEAKAGEARRPSGKLLGLLLGQPAAVDAAVDETGVELLHLPGRTPCAHGPAKTVRLRRAEAGDVDGDLHHLLLVEDYAERLFERRLQAGMEVADRLLALAPTEVGVDGVALDRAGPDDRHLDHEVIEVLRA